MKILMIDAHPDADSYCTSLAEAYSKTAENQGHEVVWLRLRDLRFDLVAHHKAKPLALEEDLLKAQQQIKEAEHLALIYPIWWGGMPALLKGFLDRVLTPNFALKYQENGAPIGLLKGRTLDIINTCDIPPIAQWWFLRGDKLQQKRNVLGMCGLKIRRHQRFGALHNSTLSQREAWLSKATEILIKHPL